MALVVGQILQNRYRLISLLGQGGMGAVYLAEDLRLPGRRCAIKEAVPDPAIDPQARAQLRQQFAAEAGILARLNHRNLPVVHDFFDLGGNEYLVMEYVEGDDLQTVLDRHMQQRGGPLPESSVLHWIDQVLDALMYLHSQQPQAIIHRDVKPSNIILTADDKVKLVDFGLVKAYDRSSPMTVQVVQGLGTPPYTPLEQYGGYGHTDARSDIYSLGVTMYVLLTGIMPPDAPQVASDPGSLTPPQQIRPGLSMAANAATLQAMAVQPNWRFQTAADMRQALTPSLPSSTVGGLSQPKRRSSGRLLWTAVILMVFLAVLFIGRERLLAIATQRTPVPTGLSVIASDATSTMSPTFTVDPSVPAATIGVTVQDLTPTAMGVVPTTPAPTSTLAPVLTREPTATIAVATATPMVPSLVDAVVNTQALNLRDGPGTGYQVMDTYRQGTVVDVQGRNAASDWLQVQMPDGRVGWMIASQLQVNVPLAQVVVASAPPLSPTAAPVASTRTAPTPAVSAIQSSPSPTPADSSPGGTWVLVADSVADFPGPLPEHKWWYLWSVGRFNFRWQEMSLDGGCYHSPNDWQLQICRDRVFLDDRGDLSLQYKAPLGGTYRFDWQAGDTIEFYKHGDHIVSGKSGSQIISGVIDWELFFFVARGRAREYPLAAQVYRLQE